MKNVCIVGAGIAGLSAAITLAKKNIPCSLISPQPSERAQSVLAEGGINAALDTMGEQDSWQQHRTDTLEAGCHLANPEAVEGLTKHAPEMVQWLAGLGVPFHTVDGNIQLRPFGGQKKRRTAYAKSSTGKMMMTAFIDEVRKYEVAGLITRYPHHEFVQLLLEERVQEAAQKQADANQLKPTDLDGARKDTTANKRCSGVIIRDIYTGEITALSGSVILAFGGMNGMFAGATTGTTANTGDALATVFAQGVTLSNLEMIQYHPTTIAISGKRCLISEAARGEGGRLYIEREGWPWYFMEEKYPEFGNLMPRDVVSREMTFQLADANCGDQVYLDMRGLSKKQWEKQLPDLREEIKHYLGLDPAKTPIPVCPGIHYFMGGIHVDPSHRTIVHGLYAAGECCSQYHGANRLGGNSLLGAVYGGKVAAESVATEITTTGACTVPENDKNATMNVYGAQIKQDDITNTLLTSLGIIRDAETLDAGIAHLQNQLEKLSSIQESSQPTCDAISEAAQPATYTLFPTDNTSLVIYRLHLAIAMLSSAKLRTESRGAHYRRDFPDRDDKQKRMILATYQETLHLAYEA